MILCLMTWLTKLVGTLILATATIHGLSTFWAFRSGRYLWWHWGKRLYWARRKEVPIFYWMGLALSAFVTLVMLWAGIHLLFRY
jgi:hypothetical protein